MHVVSTAVDASDAAVALTDVSKKLGKNLEFETALLSGRAAKEIMGYARDKAVDVIVMGTHGRTGISQRLLGSVAEAVVRLSPCLVLTVPAGFAPGAAALESGAASTEVHRCIVCVGPTDDLICETCRARIRGEALEQKLATERAGRRASPA